MKLGDPNDRYPSVGDPNDRDPRVGDPDDRDPGVGDPEAAPRRLRMFPLSTVLFPRSPLALHVFEDRYRALVADCLAERSGFGVVLISRGSEVGGGDERFSIGTLARIVAARPLDEGRWALLAEGVQRIRVVSWLGEHPYPEALVEDMDEGLDDEAGDQQAGARLALSDARGAVARARTLLSELGEDTGVAGPYAEGESRSGSVSAAEQDAAGDGGCAGAMDAAEDEIWRLCAQAPIPVSDRQRLLEAGSHAARLDLLHRLCKELSDEVASFLGGRR